MPNQTPLLYLCGSAHDRELSEFVTPRLRGRGLEVYEGAELSQPEPIDARGQILARCDAVLVIVSHASARSSVVTTDYQAALQLGIPVIPLLAESARELPADLRQTQGVAFDRSMEAGWLSLLLALDTVGLTRYPEPATAELDAELALARVRAGRIPPEWTVSHTLTLGPRRLTAMTVSGAAAAIPLTAAALVATRFNPLVLIFGVYTLVMMYFFYSPRTRRLAKDGTVVILTPEGIVVPSQKGDIVFASFHEIASTVPSDGLTAETLVLPWRTTVNERTIALPLSKFLGQGILAQQALSFYADYVARYAASGATTQAEPAFPPFVFISYARKDADVVDRLELSLQQSGYHTWVDRSELRGGQAWSGQLQQALDHCAAMIVVITPAAMRSAEVRREYTSALAAGKPVLGALARTTWRIPPELRSRMRSDHRAAVTFGLFDLSQALDALGVTVAPLNAPAGGRLAGGVALLLGQALHGRLAAGARLYRGRLPLLFPCVAVLLLLSSAILLCGFALSGVVIFAYFAAMLLLSFGPGFVVAFWRRLRYPDTILALPEGYITFLHSTTLEGHPFAAVKDVQVGASRIFRGTELLNVSPNAWSTYTRTIPATLRGHKRIAEQIAADCARWRGAREAMSSRGGDTSAASAHIAARDKRVLEIERDA